MKVRAMSKRLKGQKYPPKGRQDLDHFFERCIILCSASWCRVEEKGETGTLPFFQMQGLEQLSQQRVLWCTKRVNHGDKHSIVKIHNVYLVRIASPERFH